MAFLNDISSIVNNAAEKALKKKETPSPAVSVVNNLIQSAQSKPVVKPDVQKVTASVTSLLTKPSETFLSPASKKEGPMLVEDKAQMFWTNPGQFKSLFGKHNYGKFGMSPKLANEVRENFKKNLPEEQKKEVDLYWNDPEEFQRLYGEDTNKVEGYNISLPAYGPEDKLAAEIRNAVPKFIVDLADATSSGAASLAWAGIQAAIVTALSLGEQEWKIEGMEGTMFPENVNKDLRDAANFVNEAIQKEGEGLEHDWQKDAFQLSAAAGSLAGVAGIYAITKSFTIASSVFSIIDSSDSYLGARAAGKTPEQALAIFGTTAAATFLLEKIGLHSLIGEGTIVKKFLSEGIQESTQTLAQDIIAKYGYDKPYSILEEYWDAFWMGGVTAGGFAIAMNFVGNTPEAKAAKELEKLGVEKMEAQEMITDFTRWGSVKFDQYLNSFNKEFSFKEGRLAGLRGLDGGEARPGIEMAAPLPSLKDTKIIDEKGVPLSVYHGTPKTFKEFQVSGDGVSKNETSGLGIWFSDNKQAVEPFAKETPVSLFGPVEGKKVRESKIIKVNLDIKNPKIYEGVKGKPELEGKLEELRGQRRRILVSSQWAEGQERLDLQEKMYDLDKEIKQMTPLIKGFDSFEVMMNERDKFVKYINSEKGKGYWKEWMMAMNTEEANKEFIQYLKEQGYDGIWIKNTEYDAKESGEKTINQFVAFESSQIKEIKRLPLDKALGDFAFLGGDKKLTPQELYERSELQTSKLESIKEKLKPFAREEINDIRKFSRMLEKTDGDIETLRRERSQFVSDTIEKVQEEYPNMSEEEVIDFISSLETRKEIKQIKKERRLTEKKLNEMMRRIKRAEFVKSVRDRYKAHQEIRTELVEYAKDLPLRERGKLLPIVKNAKTQKDLEYAVERIEKLQEESESRNLRTKIEKELKTIKPKIRDGRVQGKFGAEVQEVLTSIRNNIKGDRQKALQRIQDNVDAFADKDTPMSVLRENAMLNMVGIQDMRSSELSEVLSSIKHIKDHGRFSVELKRSNLESEVEMVRDAAIAEFSGELGLKPGAESGVDTEKKFGAIMGLIETMDNAMLGYRNILEKLSKNVKTSAVKSWTIKNVHNARKDYTRMIREWREMRLNKYAELMEANTNRELKKIMKEQNKKKVVFEGKNSAGEEIKLEYTQFEAADLYMKMQDPTLRETFEITMKYTPEMYKAIDKTVSPELKAYSNWMIKEYYPFIKESMKPVYEEKFGVKMPNNPYYSPLKRFGVKIEDDTDLLTGDIFPSNPSTVPTSAKKRSGSLLPIEANNIMDVARRHELQVGNFVAFDTVVSKLRKVFGSEDVNTVIKQYHGNKMNVALKHTIDNIARGGTDSRLSIQMVDRLMGNFTQASLMLNYVPFFKQLTSYPAFAAQMPVKDLMIGTAEFAAHPVKWTKKMMESETFKDRVSRGFEKDVVIALSRGSEKVKVNGNETTTKDFILNSLIMPTRGGDMIPILPGATAAFIKAKSEGKTDAQAFEAAELMVLATQQSPHIEDLSYFQTQGSLIKMMAMYQTTPIQYFRESMSAVRNMRYGRIGLAEGMKMIGIYWVVLPALFQFISNGGEWDEESQKRALMFGPLNYYPAIGDLLRTGYAMTQGETWKDPASAVSPMWSLLQKGIGGFTGVLSASDEEELNYALRDLATATAQAVGLPESGPRRFFEGITDLITGETDDYRRLFYSSYALGEGERTDVREIILKIKEKPELTRDQIDKTLEYYVKEGTLTEDEAESVKEGVLYKYGITRPKYEQVVDFLGKIEESLPLSDDEINKTLDYYVDKGELSKQQKAAIKQLIGKEISSKDELEKMENNDAEQALVKQMFKNINLAPKYIHAFWVDPANAWKGLTTEEELDFVEGNLVALKRFYGKPHYSPEGSSAYKKELMLKEGLNWEDRDQYYLEHIVPVKAGGDNSPENLYISTKEEHNFYTPIEILLVQKVKAGEMTRKQVEELMYALKVKKNISKSDLLKKAEVYSALMSKAEKIDIFK